MFPLADKAMWGHIYLPWLYSYSGPFPYYPSIFLMLVAGTESPSPWVFQGVLTIQIMSFQEDAPHCVPLGSHDRRAQDIK